MIAFNICRSSYSAGGMYPIGFTHDSVLQGEPVPSRFIGDRRRDRYRRTAYEQGNLSSTSDRIVYNDVAASASSDRVVYVNACDSRSSDTTKLDSGSRTSGLSRRRAIARVENFDNIERQEAQNRMEAADVDDKRTTAHDEVAGAMLQRTVPTLSSDAAHTQPWDNHENRT